MTATTAGNTDQALLLELSHKLLKSIETQDWSTYASLCDEEITCFEPEALGHLVAGLPFHKFYFDLGGSGRPRQSSIVSPNIRVIGDAALVTYVRLVQKVEADGAPVSVTVNETRVWQKKGGAWKHIHFHRS